MSTQHAKQGHAKSSNPTKISAVEAAVDFVAIKTIVHALNDGLNGFLVGAGHIATVRLWINKVIKRRVSVFMRRALV